MARLRRLIEEPAKHLAEHILEGEGDHLPESQYFTDDAMNNAYFTNDAMTNNYLVMDQ